MDQLESSPNKARNNRMSFHGKPFSSKQRKFSIKELKKQIEIDWLKLFLIMTSMMTNSSVIIRLKGKLIRSKDYRLNIMD
jgi:hypothetical protein